MSSGVDRLSFSPRSECPLCLKRAGGLKQGKFQNKKGGGDFARSEIWRSVCQTHSGLGVCRAGQEKPKWTPKIIWG